MVNKMYQEEKKKEKDKIMVDVENEWRRQE